MRKQRIGAVLAGVACLTMLVIGWAATAQPGAKDAPAEITIIVPADAEVFFDGNPTKEKGTERLYVTPPLVVGKTYSYEVRARWEDGGKPVERTRKVEVTGGARVRVNLLAPAGEQQGAKLPPEQAEAIKAWGRSTAVYAATYGSSIVGMYNLRETVAVGPNAKVRPNELWRLPNITTPKIAQEAGYVSPNVNTVYGF